MGQHLPREPEAPLRTEGPREVERVVPAIRTLEGAGFLVHRPFPKHGLMLIDPFLLLDEMGPIDLAPGEAQGAPDHPHRGFETVTYLLSGEFQHEDSQGHRATLAPGDVQWMTAGDGVIHSEMPSPALQQSGGRVHGFQLWVNLPRQDKRMHPRYQDKKAAQLPTARSADGKVWARVLAGEALGQKAAIDTRTPITYVHFKLEPHARVTQPIDPAHNVFAYVVDGSASYGPTHTQARPHDLVLFKRGGSEVTFESGDAPAELLLIGGQPLNEPVARHGPFVMNTQEELHQAFDDFHAGRFGQIPPEH
ncbi:MAG: pirin family protein [Deltaproteobacteria bacterium]|nr:pirin family protein [Deltaproteobacteria bacterium]